MSSDAYNPANYQTHVKYPQHIQQQQHYQQNSYINQNQTQQQHFQQQQYHLQQQQQPVINQQQSQNVNPNQQQQSSTNLYLSLLGVADSMQKSSQPLIAIHCLESILTLKNQEVSIVMNFHIQLKTRLRLCRMYLKYTLNTNHYVNAHIEKSIILVKNLNFNDEFRYEATYLIYKIFQRQKIVQAQLRQSVSAGQKVDQSQLISLYNLELLQQTLEASSNTYPVWHCRLLFLISDILTYEKDFNSAAHFMNVGINFCVKNRTSTYTHIMFILSKGMVHLLQRNPTDLQTTMQPCASLIEDFKTATPSQNESLKIFFLVLQVTYFLQCGQMKSVKSTLKHLQIYVQNYVRRVEDSSDEKKKDPMENFQWLHKDHLGVLVYLLTVIHYLQTGCFEKAQHNSEKALLNIQRLKLKEHEVSNSPPSKASNCFLSYNSEYVTNVFHTMIVENMVRCNISMGNRCTAIRQIGDLFQLCDKDVRLMNSYASQMHCLLGLYALSVNSKEQALLQFNQSLKNTQDSDLWSYNAMNSAICYLEMSKTNPNNKAQLMSILDNLLPEKLTTKSTSLTALSHYFRALKYFLNSNYQQAKESLKETILLSNSEDLSNVTANSYLFMGQIDKLMNSFQESFDMITNGLDIADKMPDINLRIFANSMLKEMFKFFNDPRENSTILKCNELEKSVTADSFESAKMPQHALIEWNSNTSPSNLLQNIQKQTLANIEAKQVIQPSNSHQAHHSPQPQQQMLQSPKSQQPQAALQSPKSSQPMMQHSPQQMHQSPMHQQQNQHNHQNVHHQQAQFQNKMLNQIQQNNIPPKQQISPQSQKHQYNMSQVQSHISPQQHMSPHHHMSPQQQPQQMARSSPHTNQMPNQHMQQHQIYQQYHHQQQHHSPGSINHQQYQHQNQQYQQQYHQSQPHGNVPMSPQQQYQIQMLQQQQQQQQIQQQMLMNQGQMQHQNNRQL